MKFNINVIDVAKGSAVSKANKPYQLVEVSYKNLNSGKVESNKVNQYSDLYSKAAGMQTGEQYEITKEKIGEFWNWTAIVQLAPGTAVSAAPTPGQTANASASPVRSGGNWETPEERAKKQVYIIKQSSLAQAVATLSVGAKAVKKEEVVDLAQYYTDFVFAEKATSLFDMPSDDLDDVPH
jgi:hypothetical protein